MNKGRKINYLQKKKNKLHNVSMVILTENIDLKACVLNYEMKMVKNKTKVIRIGDNKYKKFVLEMIHQVGT